MGDPRADWEEIAELVTTSYLLVVAPKQLGAQLTGAPQVHA